MMISLYDRLRRMTADEMAEYFSKELKACPPRAISGICMGQAAADDGETDARNEICARCWRWFLQARIEPTASAASVQTPPVQTPFDMNQLRFYDNKLPRGPEGYGAGEAYKPKDNRESEVK